MRRWGNPDRGAPVSTLLPLLGSAVGAERPARISRSICSQRNLTFSRFCANNGSTTAGLPFRKGESATAASTQSTRTLRFQMGPATTAVSRRVAWSRTRAPWCPQLCLRGSLVYARVLSVRHVGQARMWTVWSLEQLNWKRLVCRGPSTYSTSILCSSRPLFFIHDFTSLRCTPYNNNTTSPQPTKPKPTPHGQNAVHHHHRSLPRPRGRCLCSVCLHMKLPKHRTEF